MTPGSRLQWHLLLIFLAALRGHCRYIQVRDAAEDALMLFNTDIKRELSQEQIYRRSLRCIDMLSIDGQFTFKAEQPQLHCALFLIGDPEEFITIEYNFVSIDCLGGDILKIGCDNSVVRMVSSGKFINRVTFEYSQLDRQLERQQGNSVEEVCSPID
ncbi:hypothetical protein GDO81_002678 [Engystomops pustulosus]|uniref:Corticotropin-releasing factor binding protein N-terminal domain-containing protein n=1 Tax=Engystomops pustulosus TaxID=76066 RepID=A0AAV7DPP0_ENGPU|nr:hypothetical protein GDO81_002678 [Engystomops pustulosus]